MSDSRLEATVVGREISGTTETGGRSVSSGGWFVDSLTFLIVWIADLYPCITIRPKPEIAWIAERVKMTIAWNEMYCLEESDGGYTVYRVRINIRGGKKRLLFQRILSTLKVQGGPRRAYE